MINHRDVCSMAFLSRENLRFTGRAMLRTFVDCHIVILGLTMINVSFVHGECWREKGVVSQRHHCLAPLCKFIFMM